MEFSELPIKDVDPSNIDTEHICCAIGNDKTNKRRAQAKKDWMKDRFPDGHRFKKVDVRGKVFIEYAPVEKCWYPIIAPGYNFIQCFWVSGKYKGHGLGKKLLQACEEDSTNTNGLCAVSSHKKRPFMVDKKFLVKNGFEVCDTAPPYFELLYKRFNESSEMPRFTEKAKLGKDEGKEGLTFYYSDLCPFNGDFVDIMIDVAREYNIPTEKIKVETVEQARSLPAPWGTFMVFFNGQLLANEVMTDKRFRDFLHKNKVI